MSRSNPQQAARLPPSTSFALGDTFGCLPPPMRAAAAALLTRFNLGLNTQSWPERFSPLTLQYPALQAEGLGLAPDRVAEASAGHLMMLIHTFLEDRLLDGQMNFTRAEALFVKQMLLDGIAKLEPVAEAAGPDGAARFRSERSALQQEYLWAQTTTYAGEPGQVPTARRVLRIAAGRAAMGYVSVAALLADSNASLARTARNAFDLLVTGLQWVDDLQDWREDLRTGDENLLLIALAQGGLNAYTHPPNEVREANVGHALLEKSIIDRAVAAAGKHFAAARRRQAALGCVELADLIQKRITHLPGVRQKIVDDIETEVLACLAAQAIQRATPQI